MNSVLAWPYYCQGKNMDELTQSLLLSKLEELETTRLRAQQELRMRDDQLNQLKDMLNKAITERDEAQSKCQTLLEKLLFQQQIQQQHHQQQQQNQQTAPHSGVSSIEDDPRRGLDSNNALSSSDCEESIVSSQSWKPQFNNLYQEQYSQTKNHFFHLFKTRHCQRRGSS